MTVDSSSKPARPGAAAGRRRWGALLAGSLAGFALALTAAAGPGEAADLRGSFRGNAYGTFANAQAGPVATELGRSAFQPCPCRGTGGEVLTNRVDSLRAGEDGRVLRADATTATIKDTATITGLNALGGLTTADVRGQG